MILEFKTWLEAAPTMNDHSVTVVGDVPLGALNAYISDTFTTKGLKFINVPVNGVPTRVKVTKKFKAIMRRGTTCVSCGRKGTKLKALISGVWPSPYGQAHPHLGLFSDDDVQMTVDHIQPKFRGGDPSVTSDNIQTMCSICNHNKDDHWKGVGGREGWTG